MACDNVKTSSEVTCIEQDSTNPNRLAVGYLDGSLRIFDLRQRPPQATSDFKTQLNQEQQSITSNLTFNGHKTSITSINFDSQGVRLVTGSKDTDLVVWDLVGECGLFRLKGHKSPIAKAVFMSKLNVLISCGKDMLVKFWDLDTRHCFKTIVSHRSEVNDLILLNEDTRLITGCHDNELRVFELKFNENIEAKIEPNLKKLRINDEQNENDNEEEEENEDSSTSILDCKLIGSITRESKDPLTQLCFDPTMTVFSSHSSNEKHLELYKINTQDEIKKRLSKKLKKQKRKLASEETETNDSLSIEQTVNDEFTRIQMLKIKHKIKNVDLLCETSSNKTKSSKSEHDNEDEAMNGDDKITILFDVKIACLLQNNQIEIYLVQVDKQMNNTQPASMIYSVSMPAHRTDVRTLCFSSDSTAFVSASGDTLKVWNRMSLNCIRTFNCDYALCSLFLSDDNHVLVGTKVGLVLGFRLG